MHITINYSVREEKVFNINLKSEINKMIRGDIKRDQIGKVIIGRNINETIIYISKVVSTHTQNIF